jgi:mono/diheme cytochrome c family protein
MVRLEITIGLLLILATMFVVLFVGVSDLTVRLDETTSAQRARSIERGAALYATNCSIPCHGIYGEGRQAPTLNTPELFDTSPDGRIAQMGWTGTVESYIESTIAAGRPGTQMQPWSQEYGAPLRTDQIENLTAFIMNWADTAGEFPEGVAPAEATPIPEDQFVTVGLQLFESQGCTGCHAMEGISQAQTGPELTHIATVAQERAAETGNEDAAAYIHESIVAPNEYVVSGFNPNIMPQTFAQTLSDDQINALVQYLLTRE